MSDLPDTKLTNTGLKGASVGGVIGITVWQVLSGNFVSLGFFPGLLILTAYMGLCLLLGMTVERFVRTRGA